MTDRYAIVGNPVAHSKSPLIHAEFARRTNQAMTYERLLAPQDGFAATVDVFARAGGQGLNVTVPFKVEAFALATECSERARLAKAVNTLKRVGDHWHADNTDGAGLVHDLRRESRRRSRRPARRGAGCGRRRARHPGADTRCCAGIGRPRQPHDDEGGGARR